MEYLQTISAGKIYFGKKDAQYIADAIKPIIKKIVKTKDPSNPKNDLIGVVNFLLFDGATNVQKAAKLVSILHPHITCVHGAEHVVSLFFKDIFTNTDAFNTLSSFSKQCHNIFGSTQWLCYRQVHERNKLNFICLYPKG